MIVAGLDTSTSSTAAAVLLEDGTGSERRHDPAPDERPGHAAQALALLEAAVADAGCEWSGLDRLAVGVGPGAFTGLRIGIATARALAQARGLPLVPVSSLAALAAPAIEAYPDRTVLAVLDARRREVFAAAWARGEMTMAIAALGPEELGARVRALPGPPRLAVGDGAVAFRDALDQAGTEVPDDGSPLHRVSALAVCRAGAEGEPLGRDAVLPHYVRPPDVDRRPTR